MNYTANDIVSLSPGRAFREKIGMYLSADRQEAINLGLRELIVNVQDEYEVFKPVNPELNITLDTTTRIITVSDNMRGIPVGIRDDGINSLTATFLIPHSGGKHSEGVYSSAVGINGEGNKIVCHTAEWLRVKVYRDNNIYYQAFQSDDEGARATGEVQVIGKTDKTGTEIEYVPDKKVYGDIFIDIEALRKMLQEMAMFSTGLHITLTIDNKKEEFFSKSGLIDGLSKENRLSAPFSYHYETDDCKVDFALQWVSKKGQIKGYANNLYMPDGGAFISGFKSSLTRTFNSLANTKYDGDTIRDVIDGFVSVKVKMGQFTNQQKTALANPEARTATSTAISNALKDFALKRKEDFKQVIELLNKIVKAELAADKARQAILNTEKEISNEKNKRKILSDKLKDCQIHGSENGSILTICEGDSALGALAKARPIDKVALIPIRGKIISALKHDKEKVLQNEEVKAIFSALGCGFFNNYDSKKLRYNYVGIASDADEDGNSIANLITTLFYFMCPDFIKEGRLFRIKMPLFVLKYKDKTLYAFSSNEKNSFIKKYGNPKEISRKKGIGENTPTETAESVFGAQKRWERININNFDNYSEMMEMLMGQKVEERRDFIMKNVKFDEISE
ncbi:MAG: toprim domain-containing protein [Treponema sp.]|nr:toprim domain-containing protein [Treponema sp.]